jgi:hypothetical protein
MYRTVNFAYADEIDWVFDADGNPVTPGGKELAVSIAAALASGDSRVSDVEQHEFYGWSFTCQAGSDAFFHVVNAAGKDVYLTVQMEWYLVKRLLLGRPRLAFDRHCETLGAVLASLPGVSGISWEGYKS